MTPETEPNFAPMSDIPNSKLHNFLIPLAQVDAPTPILYTPRRLSEAARRLCRPANQVEEHFDFPGVTRTLPVGTGIGSNQPALQDFSLEF